MLQRSWWTATIPLYTSWQSDGGCYWIQSPFCFFNNLISMTFFYTHRVIKLRLLIRSWGAWWHTTVPSMQCITIWCNLSWQPSFTMSMDRLWMDTFLTGWLSCSFESEKTISQLSPREKLQMGASLHINADLSDWCMVLTLSLGYSYQTWVEPRSADVLVQYKRLLIPGQVDESRETIKF